ncbi:Methyltransferase FkbM family [Thiocapsa sp. KS1]|nr:FkbM family methyltransferase [Thiocapsa sp. KS1]CRI68124.1 Methyltransferase FkbM family [Thiocapsa sp. KS1]
MSLLNSLGFILRHPLNRGHGAGALIRWVRWQLGSRLLPAPVLLSFVDGVRLLVEPGMTGVTGNVYCGLHEFEDMALVLHALRADDLFVDIGANVGSYTILGGAAGARVLAIEPIPSTFGWLARNIAVNGLGERLRALNLGLGRAEGRLRFTGGLDAMNHVLAEGEVAENLMEVPVRALDSVLDGESPILIKMDVEGFETEVLAGAERTLADPGLLAIIMELNGSGSRYGFDEDALHRDVLARGFATYRYRPFDRVLEPLNGARSGGGNTLYVRDAVRLAERVRSAPRFRLGIGGEI